MQVNREYFALKKAIFLSAFPLDTGIVPEVLITAVSPLGAIGAGYLTFCDRVPAVTHSYPDVQCVILTSETYRAELKRILPCACLVTTTDPRADFIDAVAYLVSSKNLLPSCLFPTEVSISREAKVSTQAIVEAGVHIEEEVVVGAGAIVKAGTWLQRGVTVGEGCVLGTEGIHVYVGKDGVRRVFPHIGSVVVGSNSRLGASCVVPRGILGTTYVGENSIIGNLCNLGHGMTCGSNVWISSGTMVGGQTHIGNDVTIGLGSVVKDNIAIGDGASVGMGSVVTKTIQGNQSVFGNPAKRLKKINAGPSR